MRSMALEPLSSVRLAKSATWELCLASSQIVHHSLQRISMSPLSVEPPILDRTCLAPPDCDFRKTARRVMDISWCQLPPGIYSMTLLMFFTWAAFMSFSLVSMSWALWVCSRASSIS